MAPPGSADLVVRVAANIEALKADMAAAAATLKQIEAAARDTAGATTELAHKTDELGSGWASRIAEGLLLRDALREVGRAFNEVIIGIPNEARELRNLSLQTQINVQDLQVLTAATREYGIEGEQLGRALFQLGQRIAGGDANVATAYHLMGISLDEVRDKSPMELFLATERGLGTLSGAIQDTAAKDLYGARLGASLIAFSQGTDEAVAKAKALNTIASTDSVQAMAAYADAIDRASHSVHAWVMEVGGKFAQEFQVLGDYVDKGASKWSLFNASIADITTRILSLGGETHHLADAMDHANIVAAQTHDIVLTVAGAHKEAVVQLTAHEQAARFMAATELDSAKPILEWQLQYLGHLKDIGLLTAQNAAGIGVSADQLKRYETNLKEVAAAQREADAVEMVHYTNTLKGLQEIEKAQLATSNGYRASLEAIFSLDRAEQALAKSTFDALTSEKDRAKVVAESITQHIALMDKEAAVQLKQAGVVNAAILAELDAQVKLNAEYGLNAVGAIAANVSALDRYQMALHTLQAAKVEGISQAAQEQVLLDAYTKSLYDDAVAEDARTAAVDAGNAATQATITGLRTLGSMQASLGNLGTAGQMDPFTHRTASETAAIAAGQFVDLTQVEARWMNMHPPGRAEGGSVAGGEPYVVGERGPELFVPQSAGSIMPNGGAGPISITIHVVDTQANLARSISEQLLATLKARVHLGSA